MPVNPDIVKELERFGYKPEKVQNWTTERATAVLEMVRKEQNLQKQRSAAKAGDPTTPKRGQPTPMERLNAAAYLEQCRNPADLNQALLYCGCYLTDDETKRVAGYFIRLFRGQS